MRVFRRTLPLTIAAALALAGIAQEARPAYEREYAFPIATIEAALHQLGAYSGVGFLL